VDVARRHADDAWPLANLGSMRSGRFAANFVRRRLAHRRMRTDKGRNVIFRGHLAASTCLCAGLLVSLGGYAAHASAVGTVLSPKVRHTLAHAACGVERWAVKTLADPDAGSVKLNPKEATVSALRLLTPPSPLGASRITGVETTTYRVVAALKEFKIEDDGDVHLVIADPKTGGTMIVEFPQLTCTSKAATVLKKRMVAARASLIRACGQPSTSRFTSLAGTATITGVGFFDFKHGQRGVAPNAIELHPVLFFRAKTCANSSTSSSGSTGHGGPAKPKPSPPSTQGGSCEPGYSPCLPVVADLNCSDIPDNLKPIHVTGDDPYRLDADGDGLGCE
jgi:hypothetical protein